MFVKSKLFTRVRTATSLSSTSTPLSWRVSAPCTGKLAVRTAVATTGYSTAQAPVVPYPVVPSISSVETDLSNPTPANAAAQAVPSVQPGGLFGGVACPPVPAGPLPAELDAAKFRVDSTAGYWQRFGAEQALALSGESTLTTPAGISKYVQSLVQRIAGPGAVADQQSMAYWAYHTSRLIFFATQGAASIVVHHAYERLSGGTTRPGQPPAKTPLERVAAGGQKEVVLRINEAVGTWAQDLAHIRARMYRTPWDMVTATHRQFNPLFLVQRTLDFMQEASGTLARRMREVPSTTWLSSASKMYPNYFTNSYHFQSDGWLSKESAEIYEHSTEVLFFGRQDAMQRCALLPLSNYVVGKDTSSMKLLELSAGTGRFHTYIKDNYPDMQTVCSDLSPFYLAKARENVLYWKSQRHPNRNLGGLDGTGVEFVQTAAEDIAAPDASFDVVMCVYLYHEIPPDVRANAAAEMFRVLKPGGMAILTDSVQYGDRPDWDATLAVFEDFQEPYWNSYILTDLGALFENAGFTCDAKTVSSSTKALSFIKPLTPSGPSQQTSRSFSDTDRITSYYQ